LRIGVGESTRFARKHSSLAGQFLRSASYTPDALVLDLSVGCEDPRLGIDGFYLFSFNQVRDTVAWRDALLVQLT
jgi:methylenetetrahydrofolate reductase (NADPH)